MLMRTAAHDYGWKLNYSGIALMWRGGCIIRSVFLGDITKAYQSPPPQTTLNPHQSRILTSGCVENDKLENLLFDDFFNKAIHKAQQDWRDAVAEGARLGIPTPAFSTALSWFDGYRSERLPASLIQAQRDYFG